MFLNNFGHATFQVSQFKELQDKYMLNAFHICEQDYNEFTLKVFIVSRQNPANKLEIFLVTQKNLIRTFKSIDSVYKLIQPLCYETKADEPFKNFGSLNIRIVMKGCIHAL
jgi:hypothetical protein